MDAGFSCPNRDGSAGVGGCIFCGGKGSGGWVGFDTTAGGPVRMRIGISYVSLAGAAANRDAEVPATATVDSVAAATRAAWNTELERIRVGGGTDEAGPHVELGGTTRGMTVVDRRLHAPVEEATCDVAEVVDATALRTLIFDTLLAACTT